MPPSPIIASSPLAGPIVRRVLPRGATVWLALPAPGEVTLEIYDGERIVATGARRTVEALADVHVVAVTAAGEPLRWGRRYTYTLRVDGRPMDLSPFALAGGRPGFHLFSDDVETLRFVHGSCRKPHGMGIDALELVEDLLRRDDPPQALFLTGDQIYGDDVDPGVLAEIQSRPLADRAAHVKAAGFTSGAAACHLVEFEEFVRMYLYVWTRSPRVRRVLANVATWMMFDDHDVTDDWRLDGNWVENLTDEGRRIERNALRAYALFQHWGNEPDRDPDPSSDWGWSFDTPLFRCVSLDTRTRRHYGAPNARPGLVRKEDIDTALAAHDLSFTLVVSPPPVLGQGLVEGLQTASRPFSNNYANDQEAWSGDRGCWEHLLDRMASLGSVLVLSGDVHFGFLARLAGTRQPFEIVNATASALRNETGGARVLAWLGGVVPTRRLQSVGEDLDVVNVSGERVTEELAGAPSADGLVAQAVHRTTAMIADNHVGEIRFEAGLVFQRYVTGRARTEEHAARFGVGVTLQARAIAAAGSPAGRLADALDGGMAATPEDVVGLLEVLRAANRFDEMIAVAELAEARGLASARSRIHHAQALVDGGRATAAIALLTTVDPGADPFVEGERAGLLGRAYKQLWVDARPNAAEPRTPDFEASLRWYSEKRTTDAEWLDVNVMALRHAAGRLLGDTHPDAKRLAEGLLGGLPRGDNPWARANRGEAALVVGNTALARDHFEAYLSHPGITAFHARSTLRQLTELYGLGPDDPIGGALLPLFEATILQKGGTGERIDVSPHRAGALPAQGTFQPLAFLRTALERARSVARVEKDGVGVGTAFLVDLSTVRPGWDRVLLTNAHVCSEPRAAASARRPSETTVRFFGTGPESRPYAVRQLWSSPVAACDATVLAIEGDPDCPALQPHAPVPDTSARALVNIIGHPAGMDAQLSAQDNELHRVDARYLWYRAATAGGSSGSPVFDDAWRLVGLHHARNTALRLNEGIRLDHILEALA